MRAHQQSRGPCNTANEIAVMLIGAGLVRCAGVMGMGQLDAQLPLADIIVMLAPMLPETKHMVDAAFISKVPATPHIFVAIYSNHHRQLSCP